VTGTFLGLEIATRALQAQQAGLDVTTHNVANANTAGYSRQTARLVATPPYTFMAFNRDTVAGQAGTGVIVDGIERARDPLLDAQYRARAAALSQGEASRAVLEEIGAVFNEPSDSGLSGLLNDFFGAWSDLSSEPTDAAARALVVQQSAALANRFNLMASRLTSIRRDLNGEVERSVGVVNQLADEIAALNVQVMQAEAGANRANDLRDRRDELVDRLAELAAITVTEGSDGSINVLLEGRALVERSTVDRLSTTPTGPGGMAQVGFASDGALLSSIGGKIAGLVNARDEMLPDYLAQLNDMAGSFIAAVNTLHADGYGLDGETGRAFFSGTDAATIAIDGAIAADPRKVAAADAPGQSGNTVVALAIAELDSTMTPAPQAAYAALVGALGAQTQAASDAADDLEILVHVLEQRRERVSGVSLDEEAVNMLRYQRAYEAAARMITAVDEMLDKLINQTGLVGR
jgi:flagellar hook-associated protein 1 FlgK